MSMHHLKQVLSEIRVLEALIFPVAIGLAAVVALGSWALGRHETGLHAALIIWCAAMGAVHIVFRMSCGPDTGVIFTRFRSWTARRLTTHKNSAMEEHRRYPRYSVDLPATFYNDRTSGFAKLANISVGGCKIKTSVRLMPDDCGQLLIEMPGSTGPVKVPHVSVRWAGVNECGLEFMEINVEAQGWLSRLVNHMT